MPYTSRIETTYYAVSYQVHQLPDHTPASTWFKDEHLAQAQLESLQSQFPDNQYEITEMHEPLLYSEAHERNLT